MYLSWSASIFYDHYQLDGITTKRTCPVCSRTFSRMGDFNWHMASVQEGARYPCQCGKVFSRKDVRLCHQRTCPKRSDSQSLQLEHCMAGEPTPKTSAIPSIPWLEALWTSLWSIPLFLVGFKFLNPAEIPCNSEELLAAITLRKPVNIQEFDFC